ncbi:MAG TPA: zinc-dependent alcohol dehydrogenase [Bryobacteraceae bacterium]|nr:zinc-dependent alcohol dehydrogenase [Bryobacteraceae bacterium]HOQ45923.1 zinc-dependent alcohol dehydrogenase [Bryobacteraceae bacterium]HPU73258.1 zinc-dependent alcohol dehydrogenase [Bryobacteraceae bacterium]
MKAVCWNGTEDVRVETVPDPGLLSQKDVIIKTTLTAICGSDLHLYGGHIPGMRPGDILGHEFMGEVVETGREVRNLKKGDRVVVPFAIACGACYFCRHELYTQCDNSNPNAWMLEKLNGYGSAGLFGYSHLYGGYAGGQAQFVRVPFADVGPVKVSNGAQGLSDEKVLFLSDIFPTGYQAAEQCDIKPGDTVAVWGCGPVGQFAMMSARLLGAERIIGIDRFTERLRMAQETCGADTIDYSKSPDLIEEIKELTGGMGPDACIDAVGMEAHGTALAGLYDRAKQAVHLLLDRPTVLRQCIQACRKGGTVSIPGVYTGPLDKVPIGAAFGKGLTLRMGQTNVQKYLRPLLEKIERGEIDPSFVITHRFNLSDAPYAYQLFREKQDGCIKVVLDPSNGRRGE